MTINMNDENIPKVITDDTNAMALEKELENLSISSGESYGSKIDGVSVDDDVQSVTSQALSKDESSTRSGSFNRDISGPPDECYLSENDNETTDSKHNSARSPQDKSTSLLKEKNDDIRNTQHGFIQDQSVNIDEMNDSREIYDDYQLDFKRFSSYDEEAEQPMFKPRNDLINTLATIFSKSDVNENMKWESRVTNNFYYRESYIPVPREQREMEEFVDKVVPDKKAIKKDEVIYRYLFPEKDDPKSFILKREHVTISKHYQGQDHTELKELILLNHCLIILAASVDFNMNDGDEFPIVDSSPKSNKGKVGFLKKRAKKPVNLYEECFPLSSILSIEDNEMEFGDVVPLPSFGLRILCDKNEIVNYKIHCFSLDLKVSWISALRTSVTSNIDVEEDSVYASVLCNDLTAIERKMTMLKNHGEGKDIIDKVNGYSPLHLAILTSKHLIANQLLRAGANPNTVAKDGTSPLSSAKALNNELMIDLLEHHNAKELILSRMSKIDDTRSKLFAGAKTLSDDSGKINGTNDGDSSDVDNAIKTYGRPNKHLPALMAMTSLQERGQKLSEIEIKSLQLKDAAQNYGNMAKMMREQMEKKKKKKFFFF